MKQNIFLCLFFFISIFSFSQITIDKNDMPNVLDTFRISTTTNLHGVDPALTGTNFIWDFSALTPNSQTVDTFIGVLSTPVIYNVEFNNFLDPTHKATIAIRDYNNVNPIPTIQISEIFNFFKESTASYSQVGQGAKINNISTPVKYDVPILIYSFPLTLDHKDSSLSSYIVSLPTIGAYGQKIKRVNTVDGWGVLITPLDTFNVIRTKSLINTSDTIYYSNFNYGTWINRPLETEYRWLADNKGEPVLQINKTTVTTAKYQDIIGHLNPVGIEETKDYRITVFPNPAKQTLHVFSNGKINKIEIVNLMGSTVKTETNRLTNINISDMSTGIYFLRIYDIHNHLIQTQKIILE